MWNSVEHKLEWTRLVDVSEAKCDYNPPQKLPRLAKEKGLGIVTTKCLVRAERVFSHKVTKHEPTLKKQMEQCKSSLFLSVSVVKIKKISHIRGALIVMEMFGPLVVLQLDSVSAAHLLSRLSSF